MKHAPGPWKVAFGNIMDSKGFGLFHQSVMFHKKRTVVEVEANARLIASAPELLEACKDALETIDWLGGDAYEQECIEGTVNKIKLAIAKAEGE